jgi:hypothetical protein
MLSVCTRFRFAALAVGAFALWGAGWGVARAQMGTLDATQVNSEFSPTTTSARFGEPWNAKMPSMNQNFSGKEVTLGKYNWDYSSLNGKKGPYDWRTMFSGNGKMMPLRMMTQPSQREPTMMDRYNGLDSPLNQSASYDQWRQPHLDQQYQDMWVLHTGEHLPSAHQTGQELSLQDLNRYDFRGTRSSEAGLPVTHAGTETSPSAGPLVNTPALFDFGGSKGLSAAAPSQVRSGEMVAPQMMRPDGSTSSVLASHGASGFGSGESVAPSNPGLSSYQNGAPMASPPANPNSINTAPLPTSILNETPVVEPMQVIGVRVKDDDGE